MNTNEEINSIESPQQNIKVQEVDNNRDGEINLEEKFQHSINLQEIVEDISNEDKNLAENPQQQESTFQEGKHNPDEETKCGENSEQVSNEQIFLKENLQEASNFQEVQQDPDKENNLPENSQQDNNEQINITDDPQQDESVPKDEHTSDEDINQEENPENNNNFQKVEHNAMIIKSILQHCSTSEWQSTSHAPYTLNVLNKDSIEFQSVESLFQITARGMSINKIERVENPFLLGQYQLKKVKILHQQSTVEERSLFHGTRNQNIDGICRNNFDWRRSCAHKFGRGVSFSPEVSYARHYGDNVMFLAKVLVSRATLGNCLTITPPEPFDTTRNGAGTVIVKYEDDDFYPKYIIYYQY